MLTKLTQSFSLKIITITKMLNKNTQGAKKGEANQKQQLSSR